MFQNPGVRVIPQIRNSFLSGLDLYNRRADKGYSLTDCVSMQTMLQEGLREVLTNDRHFGQESFSRGVPFGLWPIPLTYSILERPPR